MNRDAVAVLEGERGEPEQFCFTFRGRPIRYELTNTAWQNAGQFQPFAEPLLGHPVRTQQNGLRDLQAECLRGF